MSAVLFAATVFSVAQAGLVHGSALHYAAALMAILVSHEAGHYFAALWHGEPASPPFFIPLPEVPGLLPALSPFGTMGAVLFMGARMRSRRALLDIGAAGPLVGLCVALPLVVLGLTLSPVAPLPEHYTLEGQSLLYLALKWIVLGPIPPGHDVVMHPVLLAGWVGLFVTFLNLLPLGQLDGGHIAYALFGAHQRRIARAVALVPPLALVYNAVSFGAPVASALAAGRPVHDGAWQTLLSAVVPWVVFTGLVAAMARWFGLDHPPTESDEIELGRWRKLVATFTLALFALLFMPSPWVSY